MSPQQISSRVLPENVGASFVTPKSENKKTSVARPDKQPHGAIYKRSHVTSKIVNTLIVIVIMGLQRYWVVLLLKSFTSWKAKVIIKTKKTRRAGANRRRGKNKMIHIRVLLLCCSDDLVLDLPSCGDRRRNLR